jgi:putative membrane protein insertion efficiency factor
MRRMLLVPRNVVIALLRAYRFAISPLYGDVCRYHPSCSRYALESVQQSGVIVGSAFAVARIVRCNPWSRGGIDDPAQRLSPAYRVTTFGFVGLASHAEAMHA